MIDGDFQEVAAAEESKAASCWNRGIRFGYTANNRIFYCEIELSVICRRWVDLPEIVQVDIGYKIAEMIEIDNGAGNYPAAPVNGRFGQGKDGKCVVIDLLADLMHGHAIGEMGGNRRHNIAAVEVVADRFEIEIRTVHDIAGSEQVLQEEQRKNSIVRG